MEKEVREEIVKYNQQNGGKNQIDEQQNWC
jgi:hypothetical protein